MGSGLTENINISPSHLATAIPFPTQNISILSKLSPQWRETMNMNLNILKVKIYMVYIFIFPWNSDTPEVCNVFKNLSPMFSFQEVFATRLYFKQIVLFFSFPFIYEHICSGQDYKSKFMATCFNFLVSKEQQNWQT